MGNPRICKSEKKGFEILKLIQAVEDVFYNRYEHV